MSQSNTFIPGKWLDHIDVHSFVQLNKKPFLSEPTFLKKPSDLSLKFAEQLENVFLHTSKSSIKTDFPSQFPEIFEIIPVNPFLTGEYQEESVNLFKKEDKLSLERLFSHSVSTNIKKAMKVGILPSDLGKNIPSMVHPDVRTIPLYGVSKIISDKKYYVKKMEEQFQTTEWIERRLSLNEEIEALEAFKNFTLSYNVDTRKPASSAKEAISMLFLTILASNIENPDVSFSLPDVCPFIDIFIEQDLQRKNINEEEAQELVDWFYLNCLSLNIGRHQLHMTISSRDITKTTYRFFQSILTFRFHEFPISVILTDSIPSSYQRFIDELSENHRFISFIHERAMMQSQNQTFFNGEMAGNIGHEILFSNGICNLEKILYLSLNGGKDVPTNTNLMTNTQPFKHDNLSFDEVYARFQDTLLFCFNLYAESVNLILYLTERHSYHPFRYSLLDTFHIYKTQFRFSGVKNVLSILASLQNDTYEIKRNQKGWITSVDYIENLESEEEIFTILTSFLYQQLERIPLYKSGKGTIMIQDEKLSFTLPPEYIPVRFPLYVNSLNQPIDDYFKAERLEIHKKKS